jgi:hypothetical protein
MQNYDSGQGYEPISNPCRVEIKENSKGEPAVSVRATGDATEEDAKQAVSLALDMYARTRKGLGLDKFVDKTGESIATY